MAQLVARLLLLVGEGLLLGGDLFLGRLQVGLAVVYLALRVGQLAVHAGQDAIVHVLDLVVGKPHFRGLLHGAGQRHVGHAVDPLESGDQRVGGEVRQLVDALLAIGGGHVHGGHHVQGYLHDVGSAHGFGQRALHLVHGRGHLHHGRIHVGAVLEFQKHHGVIVGGLTRDGGDPVNGGQGALQHVGHLGLHFLGRGARVGGDDGEVGDVHVGHEVGLHLREGHAAQDKADNDRHYDEVGMFDAES